MIDRECVGGDPSLLHRLVDSFPDGLEWIRGRGVGVSDAIRPFINFGVGYQFDPPAYMQRCRAEVETRGQVLTGVTTSRLLQENGAVAGAELLLPDGTQATVRARTVILATGGFQADPDQIARHIAPSGADMDLRSTPQSVGDGLRLGTAAGAATGFSDAAFYGHLVADGVGLRGPEDFVKFSLYFSEHCLLLNRDGLRFIDETRADHINAVALLDQPGARAVMIADSRVYRDWMLASYVAGAVATNKFEASRERGGICAEIASLDDLPALGEQWSFDGVVARDTVREVNRSLVAGSSLEPGRAFDADALVEPPYYVFLVKSAITFPFYGLRIDADARVLDTDGNPIAGLYAAGSDIGGLYRKYYAGGIAPAIVFGLAAADHALAPDPAR